jgi:citrate lyase beta subunit
LEHALKSTRDGRDVWVANIGKGSMNTHDHIVQATYLMSQNPRADIVLLLVGVNDLVRQLRQRDSGGRPVRPGTIGEAEQIARAFAIAPADAPLYRRTALYGLWRKVKTYAGV